MKIKAGSGCQVNGSPKHVFMAVNTNAKHASANAVVSVNNVDVTGATPPTGAVQPQSLGKCTMICEKQLSDKTGLGQGNEDSCACQNVKSVIDLDSRNAFLGKFENGRTIVIMIDSGSTDSIVSHELIEQNVSLTNDTYERLEEPMELGIANGGHITAESKVRFPIYFQDKFMMIHALVVRESMGSVDILVGGNDLSRMSAELDFSKNKLILRKGVKTCLVAAKNSYVPPYSSKQATLHGKLDSNLKNRNLVIKTCGIGREVLNDRCLVNFKNNSCNVMLTNITGQPVKIKKGSKIANVDLKTSFSVFQPVGCVKAKDNKTVMYVGEAYNPANQPGSEEQTKEQMVEETNTDSPSEQEDIRKENMEKYPFLEEDDPKLNMKPREILKQEINLVDGCTIPPEERAGFFEMLVEYQNAFSLYGEIGDCDHEVELNVKSDESRYIRPYYVSFEDRKLVDAEMRRLELMGIIKEGLASFNSPVMLVEKKDSKAKRRIVLDLRKLNSLIDKVNYPFPLVEDCLENIGNRQSCILSVLDIRDAFFSIKISKASQKFTGVSTYTGGKSYYFVRLAQGLSVSPSYFCDFVTKVLSTIPNYQDFVISYMDDLLIHSRNIKEHTEHIAAVLDAIQRFKLKISPKKSLFFRKKVAYLGHIIEIIDGVPHIGIQNSKIDAITRLKPPHNLKTVRGFCGMVNYLSRFLPDLSTLLKPIRRLTRKNVRFLWSEECQKSFEEIKKLLCKAPVLCLPNPIGLIKMYVDTSRTGVGCSIFQTPDAEGKGEERLIAYLSRNNPDVCQRYSVSELEAYGIYTAVSAVRMLKSRFFHVITDHSSLISIFQSGNDEIPTLRLQKFVEKLSRYNFQLFHKQGKDMVISDFLSRACFEPEDDTPSVPPMAIEKKSYVVTRRKAKTQELNVPTMQESVAELDRVEKAKRDRNKMSSVSSEVTTLSHPLTPQSRSPNKESQNKRMSECLDKAEIGKAGEEESQPLDDSFPPLQSTPEPSLDLVGDNEVAITPISPNRPPIMEEVTDITRDPLSDLSEEISDFTPVNKLSTGQLHTPKQTQPNKSIQTPNRPINQNQPMTAQELTSTVMTGPDLAVGLEGVSDIPQIGTDSPMQSDPELTPYLLQNTLVGKTAQLPPDILPISNNSFVPLLQQKNKDAGEMYDTHTPAKPADFIVPEPLFKAISDMDIKWKRIPKQIELEKFLSEVKRRSLRDFSVPLKRLALNQALRSDPFFKPIYNYLNSGILPSNKKKSKSVKNNAEDYVLIKNLLFKIVERKHEDDYKLVLCVPDVSAHFIISHYHDSLVANHQGVIKTYYTIKDKYFIPNLFDKLVKYIQSCAVCQARQMPTKASESLEWIPRITFGYRVFEELNIDTKYMYESIEGFKYLLVLVDSATRFTLAYPIKRLTAASCAEIVLQKICLFFGRIKTLRSDVGTEFCNKIMLYLTKALGIEPQFCAVGHHQSNLSERGIKTISDLLLSKLQGHGRQWPMYVPAVCYSINASQHRSLTGFSSYELLFGRKPDDFLNLDLETGLNAIPVSYRDYAYSIKKRLEQVGQIVTELQNQYQEQQRLDRAQKIRVSEPYATGDLVYLLYPRSTDLQTNTAKFKISWLGPLQVQEVIDDRNVTLSDLEGRMLNGLFSIKRLKRCYFRCSKGNATNVRDLKESIDILDKARLVNPETVSIAPASMMCLRDGRVPEKVDYNAYVTSMTGERLTDKSQVKLSTYVQLEGDKVPALIRTRTAKAVSKEKKRENKLDSDDILTVRKARIKDGMLQLLLTNQSNDYNLWLDWDSLCSQIQELYRLYFLVNENYLPTGRLIIVSKGLKLQPDQDLIKESVRVTGSMLKLKRNLIGKPSYLPPGKGSKVQKKAVAFSDEDIEIN